MTTILVSWRGIAFGGGGITALGHVGAIKTLHRTGILSNLTHIADRLLVPLSQL